MSAGEPARHIPSAGEVGSGQHSSERRAQRELEVSREGGEGASSRRPVGACAQWWGGGGVRAGGARLAEGPKLCTARSVLVQQPLRG